MDVVFDRQTIENIANRSGGLDELLSAPTTSVTLPDGTLAIGRVFSETTTHLYDADGNFIGQYKNGSYEIGEFEVTNKEFNLKDGYTHETLDDGSVIEIDVLDGKPKDIRLLDPVGEKVVSIESDDALIITESPSGSFTFKGNFRVDFGFLALAYQAGQLSKVSFKADNISLPEAKEETVSSTEPLYMLANGIGNQSLFFSPEYIKNLETDLKTQSTSAGRALTDADILAIPQYPAYTAIAQVNKAIDALKVLIEGQSTSDFLQTFWTKIMIELHYLLNKTNQPRPVVGMGYSGGFAPLIEALGDKEMQVAGMIGLGAATFQWTRDVPQALLQIMSAVANTDLSVLNSLFDKSSFLTHLKNSIVAAVSNNNLDKALEILLVGADAYINKKDPEEIFPSIADQGAEYVVNVVGSKDVLLSLGAAGWRETLGGVDVINVEIIGASHYDYMRREGNSSITCGEKATQIEIDTCNWNVTVADFVTRMMLAGDSNESIEIFLEQNATFDQEKNRYQVYLSGWESYV